MGTRPDQESSDRREYNAHYKEKRQNSFGGQDRSDEVTSANAITVRSITPQLTARLSGAAAGKQYLVNPFCEHMASRNLIAEAQGAGFRTGRSPAFWFPIAVLLSPVRILFIQGLSTSHFRLGHRCQKFPRI